MKENNVQVIVFLIPSLGSGGMERVMSELLNYICEIPYIECHLILYGKERSIFYPISSKIIVHKPSFDFNNEYRKWMTLRTIFFLRRKIKEIRPTVILSFGELWNSLVLLSLFGLKYPIYISDRCQPNKTFGYRQDTLRKILYKRADGVIAQTTKARDLYESQFCNTNVRVIGNPIRHIVKKKEDIRENVIISVGRLISTKNFDRLIDIFTKINNENWRLIIVGGDADQQNNSIALASKIKDLKMENFIQLVGNQREVDSFLLKSSIFAFTSSSEGFPNVIGEAMSAGLPVIAYDCIAGPSDLIENGRNGFLISLFDDFEFENKLRFLMEHKEEREKMGFYARESVKKFSVESICSEYFTFLLSQ
ncbi:glycosyltransferase [Massilibacteroides vaginae]|uniref:glycosyltransferase n=1 Tax=Massilibacteroides vaginae TaxID=1673718 RepID=UPI000A1C933E|nr:glycosyltransferase [Massilibacteroides vaginae]